MNAAGPYARPLLFLVLIIAAAVRLPFVLFETPVSRDITEFQNVARHLRAGEGFTLSIRAYYQVEAPVVHYSGYVRPWMLPLMMAGGEMFFSESVVSRVLPPILYLFALGFVFSALCRYYSAPAVFCAALLLALHPGLRQFSLMPLSEITVIFFVALAVWAYARWDAPWLVGFACACAFLSRPSAALAAVVFGAAYALRFFSDSSPRAPLVFIATFLLGPIAVIAINIAHDAPLLQTPQNFLYRVLHFTDGVHYLHANPIYESAGALLADNPGFVAKGVVKNGLNYLMEVSTTSSGLVYLLPFVPLALFYASDHPRFGFVLVLAAIGALDIALYTLTWATFDESRFLLLLAFTWIPWITAESWEALAALARSRGPKWNWAPTLVFGVIVFLWGGRDLLAGYVAFREHQLDIPLAFYDDLWNSEDVREITPLLPTGNAVIASNEPWLTNRLTHTPSALVPYDLKPDEWLPFLEKLGATHLFLHSADWPEAYESHRQELIRAVENADWRLAAERGRLTLWAKEGGVAGNEN